MTAEVEKLTLDGNTSETVMSFCASCNSLFVAINDVLYCSMYGQHGVVARPLHIDSYIITVVAGVGFPGSRSNMLNKPHGIFVNINLDLYVADTGNHRIQLFRSGQFDGITIAGTSDTIQLHHPVSVVLDADGSLYIVDSDNHRIVREGSNGFRCVVGCSGLSGSKLTELDGPQTMAFDSYGNIYVHDQYNGRVQKFVLSTNTCSKYDREHEATKPFFNIHSIFYRQECFKLNLGITEIYFHYSYALNTLKK